MKNRVTTLSTFNLAIRVATERFRTSATGATYCAFAASILCVSMILKNLGSLGFFHGTRTFDWTLDPRFLI